MHQINRIKKEEQEKTPICMPAYVPAVEQLNRVIIQ